MQEQVQGVSFPLDWPAGYPRTRNRKGSAFRTSMGRATQEVLDELRLLKVGRSQIVISTNYSVNRRTGLPLSSNSKISDPGVAVYFVKDNQSLVLACDRWDKVEENMHAIALAIQAMRGMDRWGVSDMLSRMFKGFTALPAPTHSHSDGPVWWDVLEVSPDASLEVCEATYRVKMKNAHPDHSQGSHNSAIELNRAIERAREVKGK